MKRARAASVGDAVVTLCGELRGAGTPARQAANRNYLKMPAEWSNYGATVPRVTELSKAWARANIDSVDDIVEAARLLWAPPVVFEQRLAAAKLLVLNAKVHDCVRWPWQ